MTKKKTWPIFIYPTFSSSWPGPLGIGICRAVMSSPAENQCVVSVSSPCALQHWSTKVDTLRPRQNGCHFADGISKWIFMNENMYLDIYNLFLRVQLTIKQHWIRKGLCTKQATSHCLNQWWLSLLTHIWVTMPQWLLTEYQNLFCFHIALFLPYVCGSGHETVAVLLPGFAINW